MTVDTRTRVEVVCIVDTSSSVAPELHARRLVSLNLTLDMIAERFDSDPVIVATSPSPHEVSREKLEHLALNGPTPLGSAVEFAFATFEGRAVDVADRIILLMPEWDEATDDTAPARKLVDTLADERDMTIGFWPAGR